VANRKIFEELMEGVAAVKSQGEGKVTLRNYKVEGKPLPKVNSALIRETREKLRCSRAVFAPISSMSFGALLDISFVKLLTNRRIIV